jgi:hypothetical protein
LATRSQLPNPSEARLQKKCRKSRFDGTARSARQGSADLLDFLKFYLLRIELIERLPSVAPHYRELLE